MWLQLNPQKDALFLDIDGTLLDIASLPQDVVVSKQLIANIGRLHEKMGGALAFVTGRTIKNVDELFSPLRIASSGVHGAEWRLSSEGQIRGLVPLPESLRSTVFDKVASLGKVRIEDKIHTIAVHYRGSPELASDIKKVLDDIALHSAGDLKIIQGRKVFEIARTSHDKGRALERLLAVSPFKGRRPIFLGDDLTDLSAIGACLKHGGVAARVGRGNPSHHAFLSPATVRSWINKMIIRME